MELTDFVRTGSLFVVFLVVAVFSERRVWISTDTIATLGFGLGFALFPNTVLDFQTSEKLDSMHLFLGRVYGLVLICSAFVWLLTKDTRDGTVTITLMMSRVFSISIMLITQTYSYWGTAHGPNYWNEQFLWFGIFGTVLWLLGNLFHLARSSDFSTYPQHNIRLNNHLRIDSWFAILLSVVMVAFPDFLIRHMFGKPGNLIHLHVMRCIGAIGFGDAVISLQAPGFLHERDKRAQLCARMLWILFQFVPWLIASLLLQTVSIEALTHVTLLYMAPLANAVIGYFTEGNTIYRVPKKD